MIRAPLGDVAYWDLSFNFWSYSISHRSEVILSAPANPTYEPQYRFEIVKDSLHCIFARYSRGDPISELSQYFPPMLDAWEQSEALGKSVWTEQQQYTRHSWAANLDHYIVCFWLAGLALALNIPDEQWQRLLALIGNEGEDELLDRIIASRSPKRRIGSKLCHPKPYQRLLGAINATQEQQPQLLANFVQHWYKELNRLPKKGLSEQTAMYDRPYWYTLGNKQLHDSGYFGRWCVEAVAAVQAFGLDDSACLGHEHYPGDLLRPQGPTTHPQRSQEQRSNQESSPNANLTHPAPQKGFLARLFKKS